MSFWPDIPSRRVTASIRRLENCRGTNIYRLTRLLQGGFTIFNWVKTAMLMAAIMARFGVVGGMIGGKSGMLLALVFGGAMNVFSYWFSDKMVLKMYNAQEVDETSAPQF